MCQNWGANLLEQAVHRGGQCPVWLYPNAPFTAQPSLWLWLLGGGILSWLHGGVQPGCRDGVVSAGRRSRMGAGREYDAHSGGVASCGYRLGHPLLPQNVIFLSLLAGLVA